MKLSKLLIIATLVLPMAIGSTTSATASDTYELVPGESMLLTDGIKVKCIEPKLVSCKLIVSAYKDFTGVGYSIGAAKNDAIKQCNNYLLQRPLKVDGRLINPCDPSQNEAYVSMFINCK